MEVQINDNKITMVENIFTYACSCKQIIKQKLTRQQNIVRFHNGTFYDYDVEGDINAFKDSIATLINCLSGKYPQLAIELQKHIDGFDDKSEQIIHFSSIEAIVDCLIAMENKNTGKKIFISHSSKDKVIIESFVDHILCLGIGLDAKDIFCTSIEDMTMKNGENIRLHIKDNIRSADFSLLMISDNYKSSDVCQNELGAVWAVDNNVRYFMLPNTTFDKIGWLGSPNKAEEINNVVYLDQFQKELSRFYNIGKNDSWSRQRQNFIDSIKNNQ